MELKSYTLKKSAKALANYPHMRRVGNLLFVSGVSSRRLDNTIDGATINSTGDITLDIKIQTKAVIENIGSILTEAGANLSNIVDVTTFLIDMRDYSGYNEVYNTYFDSINGPARTTVSVHQLPHPHLLIEIKAIAVI